MDLVIDEVVRFNVPFDAKLVVIDSQDVRIDLEGRRSSTLPAPPASANAAELAQYVDGLVGEDGLYILIPDEGTPPATRRALEDQLGRRCRTVATAGSCSIFAVGGIPEAVKDYRPPDRLPLPPPEFIRLVSMIYRPHKFIERGALTADCIRQTLRDVGTDIEDHDAVLDFGCGCGRVIRHWKWLRGPDLHGSDYNPCMIEWCKANLPFASFATNGTQPGLHYEDDAFGFIYAISVFTHLEAALQVPWITELKRVLAPGGLIYLTLHGRKCVDGFGPSDRDQFDRGQLVVRGPDRAGSNGCNAYHPEQYVRSTLSRGFEVRQYVDAGAPGTNQDLVVLEKRG